MDSFLPRDAAFFRVLTEKVWNYENGSKLSQDSKAESLKNRHGFKRMMMFVKRMKSGDGLCDACPMLLSEIAFSWSLCQWRYIKFELVLGRKFI